MVFGDGSNTIIEETVIKKNEAIRHWWFVFLSLVEHSSTVMKVHEKFGAFRSICGRIQSRANQIRAQIPHNSSQFLTNHFSSSNNSVDLVLLGHQKTSVEIRFQRLMW